MRRLPTTDLYFLHACGHKLTSWWHRGLISAAGPNCFVIGETMLLIRRDTEIRMNRALEWRGPLVYLIDDDIEGSAQSPSLPEEYRQKLISFDRKFHQSLLHRADTVIASSDSLIERLNAAILPSHTIRRIDPYWGLPLANQKHFLDLLNGKPFRIVHLGSGSHDSSLQAIAPAIAKLLDTHRNIRFTYISRTSPSSLLNHPQAQRLRPMRWSQYRRWLPLQRFHLALYPLSGERFDNARSINKLIEHAIIGAVGIYPTSWKPASLLNNSAIAAPDDPEDWADALRHATQMSNELSRLGAKAATALTPYANPAVQHNLWGELLGIRFN